MQCESTHEFRSWYDESDFIVTCEKEGNHRIHAAKVPGLAGSWSSRVMVLLAKG